MRRLIVALVLSVSLLVGSGMAPHQQKAGACTIIDPVVCPS